MEMTFRNVSEFASTLLCVAAPLRFARMLRCAWRE